MVDDKEFHVRVREIQGECDDIFRFEKRDSSDEEYSDADSIKGSWISETMENHVSNDEIPGNSEFNMDGKVKGSGSDNCENDLTCSNSFGNSGGDSPPDLKSDNLNNETSVDTFALVYQTKDKADCCHKTLEHAHLLSSDQWHCKTYFSKKFVIFKWG